MTAPKTPERNPVQEKIENIRKSFQALNPHFKEDLKVLIDLFSGVFTTVNAEDRKSGSSMAYLSGRRDTGIALMQFLNSTNVDKINNELKLHSKEPKVG